MVVRNYNSHFKNQQGKCTKIQELINRTRQVLKT